MTPGQLQGVTVVETTPMVHGQSSISQVEEIMVAAAQVSVLLSGDILGRIGVCTPILEISVLAGFSERVRIFGETWE
jgi:hypothetical protein